MSLLCIFKKIKLMYNYLPNFQRTNPFRVLEIYCSDGGPGKT